MNELLESGTKVRHPVYGDGIILLVDPKDRSFPYCIKFTAEDGRTHNIWPFVSHVKKVDQCMQFRHDIELLVEEVI